MHSLLAERARSECAGSMRAVAGGLDHAPKIKWRKNQKALARANGTFRRASGWSGEKVARSGSPI